MDFDLRPRPVNKSKRPVASKKVANSISLPTARKSSIAKAQSKSNELKSLGNYGWVERIGYGAMLFLFVISCVFLQNLGPMMGDARYRMDAADKRLVGESRDDSSQHLKLEAKTQAYNFEVPQDNDGSAERLGRNEQAYSASLAKDAKEGISFTDSATKIDMSLTPKFWTGEGRQTDDDHIIYPIGGGKMVYTLKYNGLKEDIILPRYVRDELSHNFELSLPAGVEARLDDNGNIRIFSADPSLFGEISYGSDEDRARMDNARLKGEKTNLVAVIPAPIVKDAQGIEHTDKASFKLSEATSKSADARQNPDIPAEVQEQLSQKAMRTTYQLTVNSRQLKDLEYPISIDPTIQTTNASDFGQGNFEHGVSLDSTGLIKRQSLSGGTLGTWTNDTGGDFTSARTQHATVTHNGYLYVIGGLSPGVGILSSVYYAPISSSACATAGATCVNNWQSTSSLNTASIGLGAVVYNGYIYAVGGDTGGGALSTVQSAKINADGSLGTWATTTALNTARAMPGVSVHNGRIYVTGGGSNLSYTASYATSEYGVVGANGTIVSWTTDSVDPFTTSRGAHASPVYNGNIYVIAGTNNTNHYSDTQVAPINADGSIGTWRATTSLSGIRGGPSWSVSNGYMYIMGGCAAGSCSTYMSSVEYARIHADGSLGSWLSTNAVNGARWMASSAIYDGFVFTTGGCTAGTSGCTAAEVTTQYAAIKPAGELHGSFSSATAIATARLGHATVIHNGYIYVIGGCTAMTTTSGMLDNCTAGLDTIYYGTIDATGAITWTGSLGKKLDEVRWGISATVYNGYLYVSHGCSIGTLGACVYKQSILYEQFNTDGTIGNNTGTMTFVAANSSVARSWHGFAVYDGYLFVAGGYAAGLSPIQTVYKSDINASTGAPNTTWTNTNQNLPTNWHGSIQSYNGYMYALDTINDNIVSSAIGSSGTLGAWSASLISTTAGLAENGTSLILDKGYLYVTYIASGPLQSVQIGRLTTSGGVTDINGGTSALTVSAITGTSSITDMAPAAAAISNGTLYIVSGCGGSSGSGSSQDCSVVNTYVNYAQINNGGTGQIGAWASTLQLADPDGGGNDTAARLHPSAVAVNGCMFAIGGTRTTGIGSPEAYEHVHSATINADGTLGTWGATTSLPYGMGRSSAVTYNGYIYVQNSGALDPILRYAQITGSCTVGAWSATDSLNTSRVGGQLSVYNGYIYMTGGDNNAGSPTSTTEYSALNSNGTIQDWTNGTSLNDGHSWHNSIPYRGKLYVITGCIDDATICDDPDDDPNSIEYADITSGVPGTWTRANPVIRGGLGSSAYIFNGYMYIIGGRSDLAGINIQGQGFYAPVLADGNLGTWHRTIQSAATRYWAGTAAYNNRFYMLGGTNGAADIANTYNSSINSIPRTGSYSRMIDFGSAVKPTKLVSRGTKRTGATVALSYAASDESATAFGTATSSSDIGYTGANALTLSPLAGVTTSRYLFLRYTVDDSLSAVFPDNSNESTLTDYDVYYTSNPGTRLRGGRTFTNGVDRGLDAPF